MHTFLLVLSCAFGGDPELDALFQNTSPPSPSTPHIGLLLRSRYATGHDIDVGPQPGVQPLGGFNLDVARFSLAGQLGPRFDYFVSVESGEAAQQDAPNPGSVALLDAYGTVKLCDQASVKLGQICSKFLLSSCLDERDLLFLDRSFIGESMDNRDRGAEFFGSIERFDWWASVQNGFDGTGEHGAFGARASYRVLGNAACCQEGALNVTDDELTIGVGWFDDRSMTDGTIVGADVYYARQGWSASAELANYGDDMQPMPATSTTTGIVLPGMGAVGGAKTPWATTLAYSFPDTPYQLAGRLQKLDDDAHTTLFSAVASQYLGSGPTRISVQYDKARSDDPSLDVESLAFGITLSF